MEEKLIRLDMEAPEEAYDVVTGLLTLMVSTGWEELSLENGNTLFRVHCANAGLIQDVRQAVSASVPEVSCSTDSIVAQDWLNSWKEFFTPVPCGKRFVVLPPWLKDTAARDYPGRQAIVIEPKSAFGTGHHVTTALCLAALSDLLDEGRINAGQTFLDLGTGSGVLGLGLCLSGLAGEGWDIDPLSMDNALENRVGNGLEEAQFPLGLGSVDKVAGRRFDVVVANILARPLIEMAPELAACVKPGGVLVLSGILGIQADGVAQAYTACGLGQPARVNSGEWAALVWK
ncbi:MAG: 50S ribosomal protein L11 methyltransferase [Desulfovibrionaceae bacterium]|nr:50S ribosomal protein L11 methyltransferase [Desulfovibrionaceae bacterium]